MLIWVKIGIYIGDIEWGKLGRHFTKKRRPILPRYLFAMQAEKLINHMRLVRVN